MGIGCFGNGSELGFDQSRNCGDVDSSGWFFPRMYIPIFQELLWALVGYIFLRYATRTFLAFEVGWLQRDD